MAKSLKEYIAQNDLEGAYLRYQNANAKWREHWWSGVVEIFNSCKEFASQFILDLENKVLRPIIEKVKNVKSKIINRDVPIIEKGDFSNCHGEQVYFFKFFNEADEILWTKIGTTAKSYFDRCKREIYDYNRKGHGVAKVIIDNVLNCGDIPAESYESFLRAMLIKEYPNTWHRNDRFFCTDIPVERFNTLCKIYSEL